MTARKKPDYDPKALYICKRGDDVRVIGKIVIPGVIILVAIIVGGQPLLNAIGANLVKIFARFL